MARPLALLVALLLTLSCADTRWRRDVRACGQLAARAQLGPVKSMIVRDCLEARGWGRALWPTS